MKEKTNIEKNKEDASWKPFRVFRGGSWGYSPGNLRSAWRDGTPPSARSYGIGFRLVLQTKEKK